MRRLLALLCLLPVTVAEAACPARSDLADGIVLVQNWPTFRRADFEKSPRGVMETRQDEAGDSPRNSVIWYAHGLAPHLEQARGYERSVSYHGEVRELDQLETLGEVALTATEVETPGRRREITIRVTYLDTQAYALGECHYDSWLLRLETTTAGGEPVVKTLNYIPALGLVAAASAKTPDGKDILDYRYTWIGTKADVRR